jgi:hypothetical protein
MTVRTPHFSLTVVHRKKSVLLSMQVHNGQHNTDCFCDVVNFLRREAPDVLETTCFNPGNLPFCKEVERTELGHLFEHVLITFLCDEAIKNGAKTAVFDAVTEWNWIENPVGSFEIEIKSALDDNLLLPALEKTTTLVSQLFGSRPAAASMGVPSASSAILIS